ncbi:MAG: carbohydrate ABC transporter permease [Spirochaetales bacterium]|nr:carbohydrate ABC transporter permease [Spirochaetales bacterium]
MPLLPRSTKMRETLSRRVFVILNIVFLIVLCIVYIVPIWNVVITSVADDTDVQGNVYLLYPKSFTLKAYLRILDGGYFKAFMLTLVTSVIGTVLSIVFTVAAGYSLSQKNLIGRRVFMLLITITLIFDVGIIPRYIVVSMYKMTNTYWAIFIPMLMSTFNLIIVRNYLSTVPESLMESARIDGCSEFGILLRIIIPVAIPIIAAVTLFYFVLYWNRYTEIVMFINDQTKSTLQVLLRTLMFEGDSADSRVQIFDNFKMAVMVMGMLPVLVLYPFIQRYFISGLMLGSIKG